MIKINNTNVTKLEVGSDDMTLSDINNGYIWAKPYTLTVSNSSGYVTVTCYRTSALEPTAGTGSSATLADQSTIYHGDYIYAIGTSTSTTRYVTKSASPVSFNGDNIEYITANETITFNSVSCICGTTNNDSTCTTCATSICLLDISGVLCTTCAKNDCTTDFSGGVICDCTIIADTPVCKSCGVVDLSIAPICKSCGLVEISTICSTCGTVSNDSTPCFRCRISAG